MTLSARRTQHFYGNPWRIRSIFRADRVVGPYNQVGNCIRICRKFSRERSVFRRAEQSPAPTNCVCFLPFLHKNPLHSCAAGNYLSNAEHCGRKSEIDKQGQEVHDRRDDRRGHYSRVEAELFSQQRQR